MTRSRIVNVAIGRYGNYLHLHASADMITTIDSNTGHMLRSLARQFAEADNRDVARQLFLTANELEGR